MSLTESGPEHAAVPRCSGQRLIHVLDEIVLEPEHIPAVLVLLNERYLPGCEPRGLTLLNRWVSPPVAVPDEPNTLWLLWQVPGVYAYYSMRSTAGAEVLEFWSAVDELSHCRRRHVMDGADAPLTQQTEHEHAA